MLNLKLAIFRFTSYVSANPNRIDTKHQKAERIYEGKKTYTHTQPMTEAKKKTNIYISAKLYMGTFVVFVSQSVLSSHSYANVQANIECGKAATATAESKQAKQIAGRLRTQSDISMIFLRSSVVCSIPLFRLAEHTFCSESCPLARSFA